MWMTASSPKSEPHWRDRCCRIEEEHSVSRTRVNVKCAGLRACPSICNTPGKVMMRQAAAEAGVGLCEHLRRLKSFGLADDDVADVRCDDRGLALAVDVVVAARLESFHQSGATTVPESDDREIRVFRIGFDDVCDFEGPMSRMFVAHTTAVGVSYSSVVRANAG